MRVQDYFSGVAGVSEKLTKLIEGEKEVVSRSVSLSLLHQKKKDAIMQKVKTEPDKNSGRDGGISIGRVVNSVGCGAINVDFLATVVKFPKPDDKIRSTSLKVQGGGNTGNTSTCAARLGLTPRVISKVHFEVDETACHKRDSSGGIHLKLLVANDAQGRSILEELKADGVDTSYIVVSEEGNSPFTYRLINLVSISRKSRTCIHTPGHPAMVPADLSQSSLLSALDGARIVYFDGRLHETALVVAKEATRKQLPVLVDAERKREGLDDLLNLADYAVCSTKFPLAWTEAQSIPSALVSIMLRLPQLKFVIVTLGENGCIMLERNLTEEPESEEVDVDGLLESLKQRVTTSKVIPTCISSKSMMWLNAAGIGKVSGRLLLGTAEKIPPSELIDSTGAGDAFIGAVLYVRLLSLINKTKLVDLRLSLVL
ncbi:hypothetical protein ACLOJK_011192 [Asimina triloba]